MTNPTALKAIAEAATEGELTPMANDHDRRDEMVQPVPSIIHAGPSSPLSTDAEPSALGFTLDTSGVVLTGNLCPHPTGGIGFVWSDLDPFTQGYVEACAREGALVWLSVFGEEPQLTRAPFGFSDLSPETLAMILRNCAAATRLKNGWTPMYRKTRAGGAAFWADRNRYPKGWRTGSGDAWMPLTFTLGDDGKVHRGGAS